MNPYPISLVIQLHRRSVRIIGCGGDCQQCQPPGTLVAVPGGQCKPIEEVRVGDGVVTYQSKKSHFAGTRNQPRRELETASRPYRGDLYVISAGGHVSRSTPNHKWLTRFNDDVRNIYVVYLMQRGCCFRVGSCKM